MKARPHRSAHSVPLGLAAALSLVLAAAPRAHAAVPNPVMSFFDGVIVGTLSGDVIQSTNGCAARGPGFNVIVRDVNNIPIPNSAVSLNFSNAPNSRLRQTQESGSTINCGAKIITRITNASGLARFAPRFGGHDNGNVVLITADGVVLGLVPARSPDVDGVGPATGIFDFTLFAANFAAQAPTPETDFDVCAQGPVGTGLADFSIFAREFAQSVSTTFCP